MGKFALAHFAYLQTTNKPNVLYSKQYKTLALMRPCYSRTTNAASISKQILFSLRASGELTHSRLFELPLNAPRGAERGGVLPSGGRTQGPAPSENQPALPLSQPPVICVWRRARSGGAPRDGMEDTHCCEPGAPAASRTALPLDMQRAF